MADPALGVLAKLCFDTASPIDGSSLPYEFLSNTLAKNEVLLDSSEQGIRGTRTKQASRVRKGHYDVGGSIVINPSPDDLSFLLQYILGAKSEGDPSAGTDTFTLTERLADELFVGVDYGGSSLSPGQFEFGGLKVARAILRGQAQQLIELELELIGKTMSALASYPSLTLPTAADDAPYIFSDTTLTITSARAPKSFELIVDNAVVAQFVNSNTANSVDPTDRNITLNCNFPYDADHDDLLGDATATGSGSFDTARTGAILLLTNGDMTSSWQFQTLQAGQATPVVNDKTGETELQIPFVSRQTAGSSTGELVVVNDHAD